MRTLKLTYFKATGKFYTSTYHHTNARHHDEIVTELRHLQNIRTLPGLSEGSDSFLIYIDGESFVPHILFPLGSE